MSASLLQQEAAADQYYGFPPGTLESIAATESSQGQNLGAIGNIFQITPSTAANPGYGLGPLNGNDPMSAGAYLYALEQGPGGGSLPAAFNYYSGGGYSPSSPAGQFLANYQAGGNIIPLYNAQGANLYDANGNQLYGADPSLASSNNLLGFADNGQPVYGPTYLDSTGNLNPLGLNNGTTNWSSDIGSGGTLDANAITGGMLGGAAGALGNWLGALTGNAAAGAVSGIANWVEELAIRVLLVIIGLVLIGAGLALSGSDVATGSVGKLVPGAAFGEEVHNRVMTDREKAIARDRKRQTEREHAGQREELGLSEGAADDAALAA